MKPPWRDDPPRCVPTHTGPTRPATRQSVADAIAKLTGADPSAHDTSRSSEGADNE